MWCSSAVVVDVLTADDEQSFHLRSFGKIMKKAFFPLAVVTAAMFAYAPIAIANAPYESTMLIQKIFTSMCHRGWP